MTYPLKFRRKVIETRAQEGLTIAEAAERFGVGVASLVRWLKTPEPRPGRDKPATKIDTKALLHDLKEHLDAYHYERAARLGVSKSGIAAALARLGVTFKKIPDGPDGKSFPGQFCLSPSPDGSVRFCFGLDLGFWG